MQRASSRRSAHHKLPQRQDDRVIIGVLDRTQVSRLRPKACSKSNPTQPRPRLTGSAAGRPTRGRDSRSKPDPLRIGDINAVFALRDDAGRPFLASKDLVLMLFSRRFPSFVSAIRVRTFLHRVQTTAQMGVSRGARILIREQCRRRVIGVRLNEPLKAIVIFC